MPGHESAPFVDERNSDRTVRGSSRAPATARATPSRWVTVKVVQRRVIESEPSDCRRRSQVDAAGKRGPHCDFYRGLGKLRAD